MDAPATPGLTTLRVSAHYLAERLDVRSVEDGDALARSPLVLRLTDDSWAVLFRYGAAVLVGMEPGEEAAFLAGLEPHLTGTFEQKQVEELTLVVDPDHDEGFDQSGALWIKAIDPGHLQVIAEVLAKSTALAHYEIEVGEVFTQLEPLLEGMRHRPRRRRGQEKVLVQLSQALGTQARIMGRLEVREKPEITWDDPAIDRLYERMAGEFELVERDQVLTRKTDFISDSADVLIGMAQHWQTLRVEWYIVILIVFEIVLFLYYDLVLR